MSETRRGPQSGLRCERTLGANHLFTNILLLSVRTVGKPALGPCGKSRILNSVQLHMGANAAQVTSFLSYMTRVWKPTQGTMGKVTFARYGERELRRTHLSRKTLGHDVKTVWKPKRDLGKGAIDTVLGNNRVGQPSLSSHVVSLSWKCLKPSAGPTLQLPWSPLCESTL